MNPKPIDSQALLLMLLLSLVWGLQQVAIKAAAVDMAPVLQIALRSCLVAILVAILVGMLLSIKKTNLDWRNTYKPDLRAGICFSLEYYFLTEGLRYSSAAHITVMLYSTPIFVALGLHFSQQNERLRSLQWLGIATAFSGIAYTFLMRTNAIESENMLWGDFLGLLAGLSWAGATIGVSSSSLSKAPQAKPCFINCAVHRAWFLCWRWVPSKLMTS